MRRLIRVLLWVIASPVIATALYAIAALIGGLIPVNAGGTGGQDVDIYLRTNGVHTSFIVPIDAPGVDWRQRLPLDTMLAGVNSSAMLSFGWGDRAFYLTTPSWADLKASTAFIALTGLDTTVLHVAAVAPLTPDDQTRHLHLSAEQYHRLTTYIEASFQHDPDGYAMPIAGAGYSRYDQFFEAKGHYSMFVTCNEWVRRGLDGAGVRAPLWSPFDEALFYQLPE